MTGLRLGSLFTGYGGLDMAACEFFDAETVWTSDIDPGACKITAHRYPDVPNLGDITTVDWSTVEPIDILTGGFPCQDLSHAGKRAGMHDGTRSGLWSHMAEAIHQLRPRYVVAENVRGLLSASATSDLEPCPWCLGGSADGEPALRALGCVLGDLAELGYDTRWCGLRAADVGAPHGRFRVFILATDALSYGRRPDSGSGESHREGFTNGSRRCSANPADASSQPGSVGHGDDVRARRGTVERGQDAGRGAATDANDSGGNWPGVHGSRERWRSEPANRNLHVADADGPRLERDQRPKSEHGGSTDDSRGFTAADADSTGQPSVGRFDTQRRDPDRCGGANVAWGPYEPAIRRWERVLGRPAPAPTETSMRGTQRLSPRFVEWLMGLPEGWVTDVPGLSRNAQLKALGNGVVPLQCFTALQLLAPELEERAA